MTDHAKSGDERKTKEQLVRELNSLRRKVADSDRLLDEARSLRWVATLTKPVKVADLRAALARRR